MARILVSETKNKNIATITTILPMLNLLEIYGCCFVYILDCID
ncbi:hypothetical protein VBZ67_00535 [Campylobacter concisus]